MARRPRPHHPRDAALLPSFLIPIYAADSSTARKPRATRLALLTPCFLAYASASAKSSFSTVKEIVLAPFPILGLPILLLKRRHCLRSCAFSGRDRASRSTGVSASISLTTRSLSESGNAMKSLIVERFGFLIAASSSASTAGCQGHGVNHESSAVVIQKIDHFNHATAVTTTNHEPFVFISLPWKSMSCISHDRFDLSNSAAMLGRMLSIPFDPSKLPWRHYLII